MSGLRPSVWGLRFSLGIDGLRFSLGFVVLGSGFGVPGSGCKPQIPNSWYVISTCLIGLPHKAVGHWVCRVQGRPFGV